MTARILLAAAVLAATAHGLPAQTVPGANSRAAPAAAASDGAWRAKDNARAKSDTAASGAASSQPLRAVSAARSPIAKVTDGPGALPTDAGQQWRDYDISPYTQRVTAANKPEQMIVDWILRETGYEVWHSEPLGFLSAGKRTLRVYHTPQTQAIVQEMVDRFVNGEAETHMFGLRVVSLESPNWRARGQRVLRPVATQTQGVQAWLLAKEDAAWLLADLRKRNDYREHSSPHVLVPNAQSTVVSATRPRNFVQDVVLGGVWPGFEQRTAQFDEGFTLEFQPLLSLDGRSADAIVKCHIDQVEKFVPVMVDVPTPVAPRQRTKVDVPQTAACRLHERFRWPVDQVLLVSLGIVASPAPTPGTGTLAGLPIGTTPSRSDVLIFMESRGKTATPPATSVPPTTATRASRRR